MTTEQLNIVQRVLDATFPGMKAVLEEDCIAVENWGISECSPQYVLMVDTPSGNGYMDFVEVMNGSFTAVVLSFIGSIATAKAEAMLDDLATEAMVADMERGEWVPEWLR